MGLSLNDSLRIIDRSNLIAEKRDSTRNKLKELIFCAKSMLSARDELLEHGWIPVDGRDVDEEHQGFWMKKAGPDSWVYISIHIAHLGDGVRVCLGNAEESAWLKPKPSKEEIIAKIEEFLRKREIADTI